MVVTRRYIQRHLLLLLRVLGSETPVWRCRWCRRNSPHGDSTGNIRIPVQHLERSPPVARPENADLPTVGVLHPNSLVGGLDADRRSLSQHQRLQQPLSPRQDRIIGILPLRRSMTCCGRSISGHCATSDTSCACPRVGLCDVHWWPSLREAPATLRAVSSWTARPTRSTTWRRSHRGVRPGTILYTAYYELTLPMLQLDPMDPLCLPYINDIHNADFCYVIKCYICYAW